MTETLHVGRLQVRYRVPHNHGSLRRQLDNVLESMLAEGLETALDRCGIRADEEVCIRSVRAAAQLRLDAGERAAVAAWSNAIADALSAALATPRDDVIRYRTRRAALVDLAVGVGSGDTGRSWAWRQLGLWHGPHAPDNAGAAAELAAALGDEPEAVVAVLSEAARAGVLPRLVTSIDPGAWTTLARAALVAALVPVGVLAAAAAPDELPTGDETHSADRADPADRTQQAGLVEHARRILDSSAIGRAFRASGVQLAGGGAELRTAFAALAWLEAEPGAAAASSAAAAAAIVPAVAAALADGGAVATTQLPSDKPAAGRADGSSDAAAPGPAEREDASATQEIPTPVERQWYTRFGGLLFLLGVLDELELPRELGSAKPLARRPLTWSLHRLALAITSAAPDDSGALAFAGLAPDSLPPDDGDPISRAERAAIERVARRIAERVGERLDRPGTPPDELLDFVCRRRGEIVFDPGWIELHLPSDEVSLELRRAGLDLDPGWLPWLGAVVRFAYV